MEHTLNKGPTMIKRFFALMAVLLVLVLPSILLSNQEAQAAGTTAGLSITNTATANYEDIAGTPLTSISNSVTTLISTVYSYTLTPNGTEAVPGQAQNATPGGIVTYTYTLQNNGNFPDSYSLQAIQGALGGQFTPSPVQIYLDTGDGIAQPGELIATGFGVPAVVGPVAVDAGGKKTILVVVTVPGGATAGQFATVDLQATSVGNAATDTLNFNRTTVVNDAVVTFTKSVDLALADPSNVLTYTITVQNTGNATANNVRITDAIPTNSTFKLLAGPLTSAASSGSLGAFLHLNSLGNPIAISDTGGLMDTNVKTLQWDIGSMVATQSISITFKVQINALAAPGTIISNSGVTRYDTSIIVTTVQGFTNTVNTLINLKSAVLLTTGTAVLPQVASGLDSASSDVMTQPSAAAGSTISFPHTITNNGNASDTFDLSTAGLPVGWFISYFDSTGTIALPNANGNAFQDVTLAAGASINIVTKITIPSNTAIAGPTTVTTTATSTNGGAALGAVPGQNITDTTRDAITAVQLANLNLTNIISGVATDVPPVVTLTASGNGTTVAYPLNIANTGGLVDTINLTGTVPVGMSLQYFTATDSTTMTAVPTANTVTVASIGTIVPGNTIVVNGQSLTVTNVTGLVITFSQTLIDLTNTNSTVVKITGAIPSVVVPAAGSANIVALVTVPAGTLPNGAGQNVAFVATSSNNALITDTVNDTLIVPSIRTFTLNTDGASTVPRGGVTFYSHTITVTGNASETFLVTVPSPVAGLSYQLLDDTGLPRGNSYTTAAIGIAGTYTFQVKVTVPSGQALAAYPNAVTIQETTALTSASNTDITTVIDGLISLNKAVLPAGPVLPGATLTYTITYTNVGFTDAKKVKITDIIPVNTTFVPGSLKIDGLAKSDAQDDPDNTPADPKLQHADWPFSTANAVTFYVGTGSTSAIGGTVVPGATGTVSFQVIVN